ncbi:MAG: hypothetical protein OK454_02580 [Thaumarchaeota archaeon]|nr:hypothetical protein [Nitrososphaerota archaeon]
MANEHFDLMLRYPESLSDEVLKDFVDAVAPTDVRLKVDREDRGPSAGLEWLLPTVVVLFMVPMKSYFDGLVKEIAKEHYQELKKAIATLGAYVTTRRTTVFVTGSAKLAADSRYSRTFSLMARARQGTIKLLVPTNASQAELEVAAGAFLRFLEEYYGGQLVQLKFTGGVALLTYDNKLGKLRSVDPHEPRSDVAGDATP